MQLPPDMTRDADPCWVLGFDADAVHAWHDVRIADAIETLWREAICPPAAQAFWLACADHYAFRWYISESMAALLDAADVSWRSFVIDKCEGVPAGARPYLEPGARRASSGEPRRRAAQATPTTAV